MWSMIHTLYNAEWNLTTKHNNKCITAFARQAGLSISDLQNLEGDWLQQQKTIPGATAVS